MADVGFARDTGLAPVVFFSQEVRIANAAHVCIVPLFTDRLTSLDTMRRVEDVDRDEDGASEDQADLATA